MRKHWTDRELDDAIKNMTVIIDTREQVNEHITDFLDKHKVSYISRKMDIGDYSAQLSDYTLEKDFVVERKANIDELCGNLTADRDRFEREFLRAKAHGTKVFLVVENASWNDILLHNYRSKLTPKSLMASLLSWQTRFNITIIFADKKNSPLLIYNTLRYALREVLLNG